MLPFFLFCIYLTTNLGSLLLASAAQKKKTKCLASFKVPASACHSLSADAAHRSSAFGQLTARLGQSTGSPTLAQPRG